ncbi:MAG TPA: xanthine phosphoribosyltransferase [Stellaceae bacterium]
MRILSFLRRGDSRAVAPPAASPAETRPVKPPAAAPVKSFPVSWDELHRHSRALAWRLIEKGPWQGVIAVTRGGLVPAAIVARELDVRLVDTVCLTSYAPPEAGAPESARGAIRVLKRVAGDGAGHLIIDDLVDTGETARIVRDMLPKAHFATVFAKPAGRPLVDTFVTEVSQDTWIHFPWDTEPQFAPPIASMRPK